LSRTARIARRVGIAVAGLVVVVAGTAALAVFTQAGRETVARIGLGYSEAAGVPVRIETLSWPSLGRIEVAGVTVADPSGDWLAVDRASLDWRPGRLFDGVFSIAALDVGTVAVARQPAYPPAPAADDAPLLPSLPIAVEVDRARIAAADLAAPVVGEPVALALEASARLPTDPADGVVAKIAARLTGRADATADLDLDFRPNDGTLKAEATLVAEPGGVVHALAGLPDDRPLTLAISGSGPLAAWNGTLAARLGDAPLARATAKIERIAAGYRLTAGLYATVRDVLPPEVAPVIGDAAEVALVGTIGDDGAIAVETASVTAAGGTLKGSGTLAADGALAATVDGTLAGADVFRDLAGADVDWRDGTLSATLSGTREAPSGRLVASLAMPAAAALTADRVDATITAEPVAPGFLGLGAGGHKIVVDASFTKPVVDGKPLPEGEAPRVAAELVVGADGAIDVQSARLDAFGGSVSATGSASPTAVAMSTKADLPDLAPIGAFLGQTIAGGLTLSAEVRGAPDAARFSATFTGAATGLATGIEQVDAAVGATPRIAGSIAFAEDRLTVDAFSLDGGTVTASAAGTIASDAAGLEIAVTASDLAALAPTVAGTATLTATISGDPRAPQAAFKLASPSIVAAGQTLAPFSASGTIDLSKPDTRTAAVELAGASAGRPIAGRVRVEDGPTGRRLAVDGLNFVGLTASGTISQVGAAAPTGGLTVRADDVAAVAALAGVRAIGGFDAAIDMPPASPGTARITLSSRRLVAEGATVTGLAVRATVADVLATRRIEAEATADTISTNGAALTGLRARATGPYDRLAVTADGRLNDLAVSLAGTVAQTAHSIDVLLDRASVGAGETAIRLTRPGSVRLAGSDATLDLAIATGAGGSAVVTGRAGARSLAIDARLDGLPLGLARLAAPTLRLAGTVSGRAAITGTPTTPTGTYDLTFRGVRDLSAPAGVPAAEATVRGSLAGGRATLTAAVTAGPRLRLDVSGSVPAGRGALDVGIRGALDLDMLEAAGLPPTIDLTGRLEIDARVRGEPAAPLASGDIRFSNVLYNDVARDIRVEGISGSVRLDGRTARVTVNSKIATGGSLTAGGTVTLDPAAGFPGDLAIITKGAVVDQEGLAHGIVDADLKLSGPLARAPAISGTITLSRVEVTVPERLPGTIGTIEVEHRNVPPALRDAFPSPITDDDKPPIPFEANLNLEIRALNQILVRGRGILAEFGGSFRITGTSVTPLVTGGLDMRRGTFDIFGQRLNFTRGRIRFLDDLDPELDLAAQTRAGTLTAIVAVTGKASDPRISFSSTPELPQDEVLSYILFRKATSRLTPSEAVAFAQAVDSLAGLHAFGLLDSLRSKLGVDRLGVVGDDKNNPAIEIGGYATDNVYVGVRQGTNSTSTKVEVTVDVTDNINVGAQVGADGDSRVGFGVEWDY